MPNDLLEKPPEPILNDAFDAYRVMAEQIALLNREIRKFHPSQRCVLDISWEPNIKALIDQDSVATIRFLANGKRVKAQYLTIGGYGHGEELLIYNVNEPVIFDAAGQVFNGYQLTTSIPFVIQAEVEFLQFRMTIPAAPLTVGVGINNSLGFVSADGSITIHAWTIADASYEDIS